MARSSTPAQVVMSLTDTKQNLSEVVDQVARGESRVIVEKSGEPVAATISQAELRQYERLKEKDEEIRERLETNLTAFSAAFREVPNDEIERVLAEAHREYREMTGRKHGRA